MTPIPDFFRSAAPAFRLAGCLFVACVWHAGASAAPQGAPAFDHAQVIEAAERLAAQEYVEPAHDLPPAMADLSYDDYREIRFRKEANVTLGAGPEPWQMQLYHPGGFFKHPVRINVVREGAVAPLQYDRRFYEFGRSGVGDVAQDVGFAGFKLVYPLNERGKQDEVISFLGASYFRFIGRGQRYGASARGLAIGSGDPAQPEEFPRFREFWVEAQAAPGPDIVIHALLDSPSVTGAYRFVLTAGATTALDVSATLFARKPTSRLGVAPLTSMYFTGANDRRLEDDFRMEVHDSDSLLAHNGAGQWLFRPLRNVTAPSTASFFDQSPKGFGLLQRERRFSLYQDTEADYHARPSYWVEPVGDWGPGATTLVELPGPSEMDDNIVAFWKPRDPLMAGQRAAWRYRLTTLEGGESLHSLGRAQSTFNTLRLEGAWLVRRFIVDFTGGDLAYYAPDPSGLVLEASASRGRVLRTSLTGHKPLQGLRAVVDVAFEPGETSDVFASVTLNGAKLTETWVYTHAPVSDLVTSATK